MSKTKIYARITTFPSFFSWVWTHGVLQTCVDVVTARKRCKDMLCIAMRYSLQPPIRTTASEKLKRWAWFPPSLARYEYEVCSVPAARHPRQTDKPGRRSLRMYFYRPCDCNASAGDLPPLRLEMTFKVHPSVAFRSRQSLELTAMFCLKDCNHSPMSLTDSPIYLQWSNWIDWEISINLT